MNRRWVLGASALCCLVSCGGEVKNEHISASPDASSDGSGVSGDAGDASNEASTGLTSSGVDAAPLAADAGDAGTGSSGSGIDARPDSAGPACAPGVTQCVGDGVKTCGPDGQWAAAVACGSPTPTCAAGVCVDFPSCRVSASGTTDCGASHESCCTSLAVPGGTFDTVFDSNGPGSSDGGTDPATVSAFRLDKYLVTVGRFRQYVNYLVGGGTLPANGSGIHAHLNGGLGLSDSSDPGSYETGWDAKDWNSYIPAGAAAASAWNTNLGYGPGTASPGAQENLPMFESWYAAYAFCIWDGGFLPSQDEWEYAAAGGSQQRYYPWGSTDPGTGNQYAIYGCNYPGGTTCDPNALGLAVANIAPVGTAALGDGLWGQLDLVGNVTQWNLDYWIGSDPTGGAVGTDRADLFDTGQQSRVLHGATLDAYDTYVVPTWRRDFDDPATAQGFRCARSP